MRLMITGLIHISVLHIKLVIELLPVLLLLRPKWEEVHRYFTNCRKALKAAPVICFSDKTGRVQYKVETPLPYQGNVMILKDKRIQKLQEKAAAIVFKRQFDIRPVKREIKILGQYSNLSWLCQNLERAAGIKSRGEWDEEMLYRIRIVFPAFCKGLSMELKGQTMVGMASLRLLKSRKLYPEDLRKERESRIVAMKKDRQDYQLRVNRIHAEQISFANFLQLQGVILSGRKRSIRRYRIIYRILRLTS